MNRTTLTKAQLEEMTILALEDACSYRARGCYRDALISLGVASAYLDILDDMCIWYDGTVINEHAQSMLDIMEKSIFNIEYMGSKE